MKKHYLWMLICSLIAITSCNQRQEKENGSIDRKAVVSRHNVVNEFIDSLSSLTVGNGEFAFTVDVTGLQTFPLLYEKGVALGTQSEWAWDSFKNEKNFRFEETLKSYDFNNEGRDAKYSVQWKEPQRNKEATDWFRENAHRLQLGNIGFELYKKDGQRAQAKDLTNIRQELNLWTGQIHSSFQVEGEPVEVYTTAHQQQDQIAVKVQSPLIKEGRLNIYIRYPYPTAKFLDEGTNWKDPERHQTKIEENNARFSSISHQLQGTRYETSLAFTEGKLNKGEEDHYFVFQPARNSNQMEFSAAFSPKKAEEGSVPLYNETLASSTKAWAEFWNRGAAIDFAGSKDPRANELERRVVLSQYLTKVQCAGHYPPQETGLTFNSWFGKPHTEMHWWHAVHFALWGRVDLMEKSLRYYANTVEKARGIAKRQGYEGVRWQKMSDNEGNESPSSVAAFLIWQQPHFIYLAELAYRDKEDPKVIEKYKELVFATADFMASFPTYDKAKDRYNLGKGVIPAQEVFKAAETFNPTYEVAYWDWALRIAQQWRKRAGMEPDKKWDEVIQKLAALPVQGGVYLATESATDSYTNPKWRTDHPAVLGALGMVPESPKLDKEIMKSTLDTVWKTWSWADTWGWDFPMTAMNAARLGLPEKALDALFMDIQTNTYLKNGHNYQDDRLRIYLPGNGGVLTVVAMMAGGWDGSEGELPGFPKDGSWQVKTEGFKKMP
ncbi:hypothetical protein [Olivibacter sp. XZL3]|uniref:hypothetical protein n=1 Tax=Olivibacter sp. XZL3 TaxID=1735116 RepID=UPI0010671842|nr:hypothetical protein [Olivibacter sp. XZL3]